ncbi:MAG: Bacterial ribosome SSU maturation protein RimP [Firmicutes bacterium]|nr:Bacterial ribosome SSU maturation protein RimP [Bacillota bacterium]MDI6704716.1 ribosome maturation factor RimP [Bacillota bacterium]
MSKKKIEEIVEELVNPVLDKNNFELIDVEYLKEGPNWYLRVYIDKAGGITIDDCEVVSQYLSDELDRVDPIENSYILEVSSPGVDRVLKKDRDYVKFTGRDIDIKLYSPFEGSKEYSGRLVGLENDQVVIEFKGQNLRIPREKIASARLAFKF